MGAHPKEGPPEAPLPKTTDCQSLRTAFPPRPPFLTGQRDGAQAARRGTGNATTNSEAGTLGVKARNAPGAPRGSQKQGACTQPGGKGMHRGGSTTLPRRGEEGPAEHSGPREGQRRLTRPARTPRTTARSARGSAIRPDSRTPDLHTPPGKDGEERRGARWQNEKRGRHSQ